jgi:PPOX class probable F420-dependent enzyme
MQTENEHQVDWSTTSTVVIETRRRDGTWVPTSVSLVADGSRLYFRTYDASGKAKRLRNFPQVRVAPATLRGRPLAPAVPGHARLLQGEEAEHARALLARRFPVLHGRLVPWMHRRKGWTTLHYELVLDER